jgi:uncharacterized protein (DUF58 family)
MENQRQKDLLRKVRRIDIVSRKVVDAMLAGEYKSVFKGRGIEFDEVREYQPGDEIRTVDWNVTARTGKPYVKRYIEEREQTLFFVVDMSASGTFGSTGKTKTEIAAEICGLLAFSAIKNNDKVGLIIFTDRIELFIPPQKGQQHVLYIIREILGFDPAGTQTDIAQALDYLGRMMRKKCVVFLVSDFQDAGYEKALRLAAHHYDLIAVSITDPRELSVPNVGLVELSDPETGRRRVVDTASAAARRRYEAAAQARQQALREQLSRLNIDQIDIQSERDYVRDLIRFFKARERRQLYDVVR